MNILEQAIIYATQKHEGAIRKSSNTPYILHPMEVALIISTITTDLEVITAGVLHDVVEDSDGSLDEISSLFGDRVAYLVSCETEEKFPEEDPIATWQKRKELSLKQLASTTDKGARILWLADKLSNIRSIANVYAQKGDNAFEFFHQKDNQQHLWYYRSIAEILEADLNTTGAYKEFVSHINFIWPGTFNTDKTRYRKYREYSLDNCKVMGKGFKSTVYRYDDELVIKAYRPGTLYKDIEKENLIAKKAFVAGIPTAICFGIVKINDGYGSMYELINASSITDSIARDNKRVCSYAKIMANVAKTIHSTKAMDMVLPDYFQEVYSWVNNGIGKLNNEAAIKIVNMLDALPKVDTLIHGDFHSGNVMIQKGEPLIIDMGRLSVCHPIVELAGVYMFYIAFGEVDKSVSEDYLGFPIATQKRFFEVFMKEYLDTNDEEKIAAVTKKAALLAYTRLIRRYLRNNPVNSDIVKYYEQKVLGLLNEVSDLDF